MFDIAWNRVNDAVVTVARCVSDLANELQGMGSEAAIVAPDVLADANAALRGVHASLSDLEAQKEQLTQAFGGMAYIECPRVMFAPIARWHSMLDASRAVLGLLHQKYVRTLN